EKRAIYVQDLYSILHALWVDDTKALHGRIQVQLSLMLLLSGATATRPGALIESGSARGSNKALSYEHITLLKVCDTTDRECSTIVAKINLVHIKNSGGKGRWYVLTILYTIMPFTDHTKGRNSYSTLK